MGLFVFFMGSQTNCQTKKEEKKWSFLASYFCKPLVDSSFTPPLPEVVNLLHYKLKLFYSIVVKVKVGKGKGKRGFV